MRNERGSVTIYLVIVFMSMVLLFGLFIDLGRILIAQNQLRRAVNASARSVLAEYNTGLRTTYGLFAANNQDYQSEFQRYVAANLSSSGSQKFSLMDFRYEGSSFGLHHPYNDTEVLKKQILEEVKYKAPVDMGRELIDKFMQIRNAAGFFVQSNEIRKSVARIDDSIEDMHESNQKIQQAKLEIENLKSQYQGINEKLRTEHDAAKRRRLKEEKEELVKQADRLKTDIGSELYKSNRASLEAETQLKKIKETKRQDVFSTDAGKPAADLEGLQDQSVSKEIENQVDAYNDKVTRMKAEITDSRKLLTKDTFNLEGSSRQLNKIGIETASKAYQDRQSVLNGGGYHNPYESELKNQNEMLKDQFSDLSKNFKPYSIGGAESFNKIDGEKANGISGYLGNLYSQINVKDTLLHNRDEMFINEYILNYFSNLTSDPKGEAGYALKNLEAEYICYGDNPKALAVSETYMVRFVLDSMGYFAFSKGIPELTVRTAYSLMMGAIQGSIDTYKLIGKKEAVSLVVVHPNNPLKDVTLTYKDHLRIFLLLHTGESAKLQRINETIKNRSGFNPDNNFTSSQGEATASIKLWFLPMAGIHNLQKGPFGTTVKNGRCYISKHIEFGY